MEIVGISTIVKMYQGSYGSFHLPRKIYKKNFKATIQMEKTPPVCFYSI